MQHIKLIYVYFSGCYFTYMDHFNCPRCFVLQLTVIWLLFNVVYEFCFYANYILFLIIFLNLSFVLFMLIFCLFALIIFFIPFIQLFAKFCYSLFSF